MVVYNRGPQNIIMPDYQVIRLSEGCPHRCPWCYEWREIRDNWKVFDIPEIVRRDVRITDMNILAKPDAVDLLKKFKDIRVDGKVVYPWLVCGIDYRFLTKEIAAILMESRFKKIHIAWDGAYVDQLRVKKAVEMLKKVGYKDISIFMICNHPTISYETCLLKLNLCKYWNCKVNDCWFDNQVSPKIEPIGWTKDEIKSFRHQVRKHNHFVNFGYDPELK